MDDIKTLFRLIEIVMAVFCFVGFMSVFLYNEDADRERAIDVFLCSGVAILCIELCVYLGLI